MDSLRSTYDEVESLLRAEGVLIYPAAIDPPRLGPRANWPDEDWREFLRVRREVGARVVYLNRQVLGADEVKQAVEHWGVKDDDDEMGGDQRISSYHEDRHQELLRHLDEVYRVTVEFVIDRVIHTWESTAQWWTEPGAIRSEIRSLEAQEAQAERRMVDAHVEAIREQIRPSLYEQIARDRRFYGLPKRDLRQDILYDLLPEFVPAAAKVPEAVRNQVLSWFVYDLASEAWKRFEAVVRLELEAEAIASLDSMAAELSIQNSIWSTAPLKMREGLARRFLIQRYCVAMPHIADMLARSGRPSAS